MRLFTSIRTIKFVGIFRHMTGFLFFPKKIGNEIRWLEYSKWTEEYQIISINGSTRKHGWVSHYWL